MGVCLTLETESNSRADTRFWPCQVIGSGGTEYTGFGHITAKPMLSIDGAGGRYSWVCTPASRSPGSALSLVYEGCYGCDLQLRCPVLSYMCHKEGSINLGTGERGVLLKKRCGVTDKLSLSWF